MDPDASCNRLPAPTPNTRVPVKSRTEGAEVLETGTIDGTIDMLLLQR
jgi:hypothetical protein